MTDSQDPFTNLKDALATSDNPRNYFDSLAETGKLSEVFPEIDALKGVEAGPPGTHQEGDAYEHTMMVLNAMHDIRGNDVPALLAALAHDLGKGRTPDDVLPSHYKHERRGMSVVDDMEDRLNLPSDTADLMREAARFHMRVHKMDEMGAAKVMDMVMAIEESTSPFTIDMLVDLGEADTVGRDAAPGEEKEFDRGLAEDRLSRALQAFNEIDEGMAVDDRSKPADAYTDSQIENFVKQDRVERMRELKHA